MIPDLGNLLGRFGAETVLALAIPAILLADLLGRRGGRGSHATWAGILALVVALLLALFQESASGALLTKLLVADGLITRGRTAVGEVLPFTTSP